MHEVQSVLNEATLLFLKSCSYFLNIDVLSVVMDGRIIRTALSQTGIQESQSKSPSLLLMMGRFEATSTDDEQSDNAWSEDSDDSNGGDL